MTQFYLDENVSLGMIALLQARGHQVIVARRLLPERTSDHHHLAMATRSGWVLVTHDRGDYLLLHRAWRDWFTEWGTPPVPKHAGIIRIPQPPTLSAEQAAALLAAFFAGENRDDEVEGGFVEWTPVHGWRLVD